MPDIPITVSLFTPTKLKVDPPVAVAAQGTTPTLRWKPAANVTIQYIGFADPVGPDQEISIPAKDASNPSQWIASDRNSAKGLFTYTVYARNDQTGDVISSDPQIENEGKAGNPVGG